MRLRGKKNIGEDDKIFYNSVLMVAAGIKKRIADELIPSFILRESLDYFSDLDQYESCIIIKDFYDNNPSIFIDISRSEWFGTMRINEK